VVVVETRGLIVRFPGSEAVAVNRVDLESGEDELLVLLGASGSGNAVTSITEAR
jgi:ABC-type taurine transport system ATPase subunit